MSKELTILKDKLVGPIQRIEDPEKHSVEEIMSSYFREILFLARKYTRATVEYEDLVVEGLIGLLDAIRRWDPSRSKGKANAFHNLAIVRIKSNMFEYFLSNNSSYKVPAYMARAMTLVDQIYKLIDAQEYPGSSSEALENHQSPAFEENAPSRVVSRVKFLKAKVQNLARNSGRTYEEMVALVLKVKGNIECFENEQEMEISPEQEAGQKDFLSKFLSFLGEDAREVLTLRLLGHTLEEIGDNKGFPRERARQIEEDTIDFLQQTRMFKDAVEE